MGRHGASVADAARRRGPRMSRPAAPMVVIIVAVLVAIGLGIWWWTLRPTPDPIDAHPVPATARVLTSPGCGHGSATSVRFRPDGAGADVTATLDGCGYAAGQPVDVEYLQGHPADVRLAGTSTAGPTSPVRAVLPFFILAVGLVGVAAAMALLLRRPGSRRSRRRRASVSVADLRARVGLPGDAATPHWSTAPHEADPGGESPTEAGSADAGPDGTQRAAAGQAADLRDRGHRR